MINTKQYFEEHIHEMENKVLGNWTPRMIENGIPFGDLKRIQDRMTGWADWDTLWNECAETHLSLAKHAMEKGHYVTAGEEYRRSAMCYHFGSFMLFNKPEVKKDMHDKCMAYYVEALKYLAYPGVKVEIPFTDGKCIPAYYRKAYHADGRLVLVIPGADATKEEASYYDEIFLSRGISTLTMDGPGQGECQGCGIYYRKATYDSAYKAVVKYIKETLHYTKLGVFGISLGGYLSPRAACVCPDDFMACVGVAGPYQNGDFRDSGPMFPADFSHVMGVETVEELVELNDEIDLSDVIGNMKCDLLIYHGDKDRIVPPHNGQAIYDGAVNTRSRQLVMVPGGNHVCNSHAYLFRTGAGDFMLDHLK